MMRIVICGPAHPYRGGIAAYNERLAQQFLQEGDAAAIYTFKLQYPAFLFPGKTQFDVGYAPQGVTITRAINSVNPLNWFSIGMRLRRTRPDLIILRYWLPFLAPALGFIARIVRTNRHTRIVTIFDNVIPHEKHFGDRMLTRFFVKSIHGALVMTKAVERDLREFSLRMPCVISPHPLFDNYSEPVSRAEALVRLKLCPAEKYILFFGFIREYKGLDLLIEAMADPAVRSLGIKLIVAGEFYEDEKRYFDLIHQHDLADRIIFHSHFISDEEVRYYFSAASLVVQPYRSATQSGVTQVAYHFNKPMVVTNVGGLAEIVPDGICGYVVEPEPEAIAGAITDFFTGDEERFKDGIIEQKKLYTWERMTEALRTLSWDTQRRRE
ncbi:MAG: glycosyltransferase [Bacteroidales bacterium]|jgi:glycosyltransferase involved in cell wall biosynthesis|nr:glycosyltransferase [Bacteroidales bacterium]